MEMYQLPQGKITIILSNKELSVGLLELASGEELPKHNRPVKEQLMQLCGTCTMQIFDGEEKSVLNLGENEKLEIPPNQYHIHSNKSNEKSITMWKFEGDITKIIEKIRRDGKLIK